MQHHDSSTSFVDLTDLILMYRVGQKWHIFLYTLHFHEILADF